MMKYFCCNERRREAIKSSALLNGIDFLEVQDDQKTLFVHFINPLTIGALAKENICIEGGERIRNISIDNVPIGTDDQDKLLIFQVDKPGDFSTYTLRLVKKDAQDNQPPDGFDQILSAIDFSFKVDCHSDFDCLPKRICPTEPQPQPDINYLAKDFASFRQLMLDRMALLMPQWKERNPADVGIVLVELLAYVGDYLSYQQDAIATEAYLGTARRRISVRRHTRLVDYFMHDGCNARAFVQVDVNADITLPKGTQLLTRVDGQPVCIPSDSPLYEQALEQKPEVFETMHTAMLFQVHNELKFYTWGARECCLPKGATCATLSGRFPNLKAGDLLIFTEKRDSQTGTDDATPARRHVVRLIHVMLSQDELGGKFLDKPSDQPVYVTEIQWDREDELPFPFCISAITDKDHGEKYNDDVSIALGNVVLADYGLTIKGEFLFSWDDILEKDNRFIEFLKQTYGIDWVEEATIEKIDSNSINIYTHTDSLLITLNSEKTKVSITIDSVTIDELIAKMENGKPKIYKGEYLGEVPKSTQTLFIVSLQAGDRCQERKKEQVSPRFSPHLKEKPLTFAVPYSKTPVFDFDFNPQYEIDLDSKNFSQGLRQQFVNQRIEFKNTLSIQGRRGEWSLSDGERAYIVRKENGKLNVYELPELANKVMLYDPKDALPAIVSLSSKLNSKTDDWTAQRDLLSSEPDATDFVVEVENDGTAYLRFGNYEPQNHNIYSANHISQAHGLRPNPGTTFTATYRVGNGVSGNVGAEAIAHVVFYDTAIDKVHNPLPAKGGVEPESIENARQSAPSAFRTQERAVTPDDYAQVAKRYPGVQSAAATFRWTGSWHTVFVTIDRLGGLSVDDDFKKDMWKHLERYRMAGYDVEIDGPRFVSLEIDMLVCVKPSYFRRDVENALLQVFSNRILPDRRKGVFHPDNFTFGQPVYRSSVYAAAQAVEGVSSVQIMKFQRQDTPSDEALNSGKLILGRLEIARLDNDPNFPEHGVLRLILEGGK